MAHMKFENHSLQVEEAITDAVKAYLYEAAGELQAQAARNSRVDTGQLKNSWDYKVDESTGTAVVGSPLENAIWEEFGTGEYALHGDGRKGGWRYQNPEGDWIYTVGKKPHRGFYKAFTKLKSKLIKRAEQVIGSKMK